MFFCRSSSNSGKYYFKFFLSSICLKFSKNDKTPFQRIQPQYRRATKILCNTSYTSVKSLNCSLNMISESKSLVNLHAVGKKPIFRIVMDLSFEFRKKHEDKFAEVLNWTKIDVCKFASETSSFPFIREFVSYVKLFLFHIF